MEATIPDAYTYTAFCVHCGRDTKWAQGVCFACGVNALGQKVAFARVEVAAAAVNDWAERAGDALCADDDAVFEAYLAEGDAVHEALSVVLAAGDEEEKR